MNVTPVSPVQTDVSLVQHGRSASAASASGLTPASLSVSTGTVDASCSGVGIAPPEHAISAAKRQGIEPRTIGLTGHCSTIELPLLGPLRGPTGLFPAHRKECPEKDGMFPYRADGAESHRIPFRELWPAGPGRAHNKLATASAVLVYASLSPKRCFSGVSPGRFGPDQ